MTKLDTTAKLTNDKPVLNAKFVLSGCSDAGAAGSSTVAGADTSPQESAFAATPVFKESSIVVSAAMAASTALVKVSGVTASRAVLMLEI